MFVKHSGNTLKNFAKTLFEDGIVVVPVLTDDGSKEWNKLFWEAVKQFPEFKDENGPFVMGGFGALGNPSSFHHPNIRKFRRDIKNKISKPIFKEYEKLNKTSRNLELLIDRLAIRSEKQGKPTAEAWHRDVFETGIEKDETIFGGWINLDKHDFPILQKFNGIKKTHLEPDAETAKLHGGGFSKIPKDKHPELKKKLKEQGGPIVIPPGSIIIFPQQITHSIVSGKQPSEPTVRLFVGHRLTNKNEPLFDDIDTILQQQKLPRIPSNQLPTMYAKNHIRFFLKTKLLPWVDKFNKNYLEDGKKCSIPRIISNLNEEDKFENYSVEDILVVKPESLIS